MVQQDVVLTDRGEDVLRTAGLDLGDLAVRGRHERTVLQVRTVDATELEQHGHIQRGRQTVHLVAGHAELVGEQLGEERAGRVGDLQADRRSEAAAQQLLLHRVEQVLGVVLLHVDVLVTGHAEGTGLLDDHAREQRLQVRDDQVLHRDEAVALLGALLVGAVVDRHQTVEVVRNLHASEVRLAGRGVLHDDGQVQRLAGDVRERVGRVHAQRGQDREHLLTVVARQTLLLGGSQLVPVEQHDALVGQGRQQRIHHVVGVLVLHDVRLLAQGTEQLARAQSAGGGHGDAGIDAALQAGHTDHEEFVQVGGEDRGEAGAFDQRQAFVLGELHYTPVELEPAQLTLEEAVIGQRGLAVASLAPVVLIGFGDVLSDLAAQDRLR